MIKLGKVIPLRTFRTYCWLLEQDKIGNQTLLDLLKMHLTVYRSRIDKHYAESSAVFQFWSASAEQWAYRLAKLQREYDRKAASLYITIKNRGGRQSEAMMKAMITGNRDIQKLEDQIDILTYKVRLLKTVVEAMKMRNDSIVNLGAQLRKELGIRDSTNFRSSEERDSKLRRTLKGR